MSYILTQNGLLFAAGDCDILCLGIQNPRQDPFVQLDTKTAGLLSNVYASHDTVFMKSRADNMTYSSGDNDNNQLCFPKEISDGTSNGRKVQYAPRKVEHLYNVGRIRPGKLHTLFQKNQTVFGCGYNGLWQLGYNNTTTTFKVPVVVYIGSHLRDIAATNSGSLILTDDGIIVTGYQVDGELGGEKGFVQGF